MDPLRQGGYRGGEEGRSKGRKQADVTASSVPRKELLLLSFTKSCFGKLKAQLTASFTLSLFLTCPEGGSLPMVVVVGKAGEAWHAAGVVVLEPLEEFAKFLPAFLLLLQPLTFHLRWDSEGKRKHDQSGKTK